MLDDIPALEPSLSHKSSLLAKVRRQQVAKNLPDYIFAGLAALGCSDAEISTLTRCPKDDLKDKAQPISEGKARLKHALRKAQLKAALKGNPSMLIWLGKAILGQSDQPNAAPQHTNIVVTADLLSNLQRSYQSTLSDIRRSKSIELSPDKQPALPVVMERWEQSVASEQDYLSEPEQPHLPSTSQPTDSVELTSDSLPITSHNAHSVYSPKSLSEKEALSEEETHPPGVPPPTKTPTPTPKRLISHGLEKSKVVGKSKKASNYGVGVLAERWSGGLKKLKGARGGSRKEKTTQEGTA